MIGKWVGWYEYNDVRAQLLTAAFKSGYTIQINSLEGNVFSGTVSDDPNTSPMHEAGKVEGHIDDNKIFLKR